MTAPSLGIRPTNERRDLVLVALAQQRETRSRPDERAACACRNVDAERVGRLNDSNVLGEDAVACGKRNCLAGPGAQFFQNGRLPFVMGQLTRCLRSKHADAQAGHEGALHRVVREISEPYETDRRV